MQDLNRALLESQIMAWHVPMIVKQKLTLMTGKTRGERSVNFVGVITFNVAPHLSQFHDPAVEFLNTNAILGNFAVTFC